MPATPPTRSGRHRLVRDRAGQSLHPPHARTRRRWPGRRERTWSRSPTRSCRRRAGRAIAGRFARTWRRGTRWRSFRAGRRRLRSGPASSTVYEQTMRRTGAAAHYFFGAAYFDRVLEADRTWLALALAPRWQRRCRLARRRQRRLPPLLPQRQRRLAPARLADEERGRQPDRALRRARTAAQPRRRHLAAVTRSRSSSAASPTARSRGTARRSSATLERYEAPRRRPCRHRLLPRLPRPRLSRASPGWPGSAR